MELNDFYEALLPPQGGYALFQPSTQSHTWATTLTELVAKTQSKIDAPNVYFATGSYLNNKRSQATCTGKKCFYIDIDAGPEKFAKNAATAWPTLVDAKQALGSFIAAFGLVPSIVVSSGVGLHVYWALNEVLSGDTWTAIAARFKQAPQVKALRADPTATADSARVLRPPGTLHGNGQRVRAFDSGRRYSALQFRQAIDSLGVPDDAMAAFPEPPSYAYDVSINDDTKPSFLPTPTSGEKITLSCPAMRECKEAQGNVVEPEWRAMLGILKHCVDGPKLAHAWSKGHPQYEYSTTQSKFDRYVAGPSTCETFAAYTDKCRTECEHWGKIKSPIVLGRITEEEKVSDPALAAAVQEATPAPFDDERFGQFRLEFRGNKQHLCGPTTTKSKGADGKFTEISVYLPITSDVFWLSSWTESGEKNHENAGTIVSVQRKNRIEQFPLPMSAVVEKRSLLTFLAEKSIIPINHEANTVGLLQTYVNEQIKRIRESASKPIIRDHLGFHMDAAGDLFCAYGEVALYKDGTIVRTTLDASLDHLRDAIILESLPKNAGNKWGPDAWNAILLGAQRQAAFYKEWYGQPGLEVAQLGIMLQMASPLLMFAADEMVKGGQLPSIGLTVSLYSSGSGKGKTSIQLASSYAYGNAPNMLRQGDRNGMTFNAQIATAASLGTFPFPMDEVTGNTKEQVADSINRMAQGIEKSRAIKQGGIDKAPVRWALITTVSTNIPQRELISEAQRGSDALQMRLIELNCDVLPARPLSAVPKYEAAVASSMRGTKGSIGAMIHLTCMKAGYDRIRELIEEKKNYIIALTPGENKERFILRGLAATLVLQDILETLGISFFDKVDLERELIKVFASVREHSTTAADEPARHFLEMMTAFASRIYITKQDITSDGDAILENAHFVSKEGAVGRLCRESGALYVSVEAIRKWCVDIGISPSTIIADARKSSLVVDYSPGKATGIVQLSRGIRGQWTPKMNVIKASASALRGIEPVVPANVTTIHKESSNDRTSANVGRG